ncbi:hypothetical protein [Luteimonas sp. A501]
MISRFASSMVAVLTLALFLVACSEREHSTRRQVETLQPRLKLVADAPPASEQCDSEGRCNAALAGNQDALALCEGDTATLYWTEGRRHYLLACECKCTSHDNYGWLVDGSSGKVQGVALGKPAIATELVDVDAVSDILAPHPFCEAIDPGSMQAAEFVSLIKQPTGDEDTPYCFSPRAFITSSQGLVIEDNGSKVPESDEEVFLLTSADVAAAVLALARQTVAD